MDAQGLADAAQLLVDALLKGFLVPVKGNILYIICWREKLYSGLVLMLALFVCKWPMFFLPCVFAFDAFLLLILKNPARLRAVVAEPDIVPLNDKGYIDIAQSMDVEKMAAFITHVITSMQGTVLDPRKLKGFASFAFLNYYPVTSFDDLKQQLRSEAKNAKHPFVSFPTKPMKEGTLIVSTAKTGLVRFGEIVKCTNPGAETDKLMYQVKFTGLVQNTEELNGDALQLRTDLGWLSGSVILSIIPSSIQAAVNSGIEPVQGAANTITQLAEKAHSVVAWENRIISALLTTGCICISLLLFFIIAWDGHHIVWEVVFWVLKVVVAIVICVTFALSSSWLRGLLTRLSVSYRAYHQKDAHRWTIFTDTSKDSTQK